MRKVQVYFILGLTSGQCQTNILNRLLEKNKQDKVDSIERDKEVDKFLGLVILIV